MLAEPPSPHSAPHPPAGRSPRRGRHLAARIPLLDAVPGLGDRLADDRLGVARRIQTRVLAIRRGTWDAQADASPPGLYGFVIATGTILRLVSAEHRVGGELLGPGDVVQPWRDARNTTWRAVEDVTVALLDLRLLVEAAALPELSAELLSASAQRTQMAGRQLVIAQWASMDERLVAVVGLLAERWGVVTPAGIVLPDFLTHSVLAPLVAARRPSVTTALRRLAESGRITRRPDGRWLIVDAGLPGG